jgi:hypothetical protein
MDLAEAFFLINQFPVNRVLVQFSIMEWGHNYQTYSFSNEEAPKLQAMSPNLEYRILSIFLQAHLIIFVRGREVLNWPFRQKCTQLTKCQLSLNTFENLIAHLEVYTKE